MTRLFHRTSVSAALAAALLSACGGGAAAPASEAPAPAAVPAHHDHGPAPASTSARGYTRADVDFMTHMIAHHAQALVMTDLVPARTGSRDLRLVAERIAVSQRDEIALMQKWLRDRGEPVPEAGGHAAHHAGMPGMLSPGELARLAAASGPAFERLFLASMIRHHEGALVMVRELFASPAGGQESEVFRLASDVEADQEMEIARMRALLAGLAGGATR